MVGKPVRQKTGAGRVAPAVGQSVRLFTAIDLPEDVRGSLVSLCRGMPGGRWVRPDQLHLTLRFIGAVDRDRFAAIKKRLATIAAPPFMMALKGTGSFPPSGQPRVLWAGVEAPGLLASLRDRIEEQLVAAGCEPERRPFSPHITLARLRDFPRNQVVPYLTRYLSYASDPFEVTEFRLYSSVLSGQGSTHTVEARYPLADAAVRLAGT